MNGLDWVVVGVGAFCVLRGIMRGAVSQIFGIAGVLGGFVLASHHYETLAAQLARTFPKLSGTPAISFILLFCLTWFCIALAGYAVARLLRKTGLGFLDRLWGGVIGFGKALLIAVVAISMLTVFVSAKNPLLTGSVLVPYIQDAARIVVQLTPESVQKAFEEKRKALERYWLESGEKSPGADRPTRPVERKRK
ncbi:MAG TPA: CvpA family protein [Syntrophobacter fumaroxidans]|nr:CvpA family protein [Syntrophobacter fumaroxidans]